MEAALTNPSGRMTLGSSAVRIGSAQDNHVVINDPKVSPHHAEIRLEGEHTHTLTDLGSMTGTFVNERRLDSNISSLLRPNDAIRIGDAVFNYEVTGGPIGNNADISPLGVINRPPQGTMPQMGSTGYGDPGYMSSPAASPQGISSSLYGQPQGPSSYGPASSPPTPQPAMPGAGYPSTPYSPSSALMPPPTGGIAPVSPLGSVSPTYTVASLLEKANRRKLWIAGGLTALVILLVAILFGVFHSPGRTLDTFCSALQSGDYQTAYNQLSPGLQGQIPESQFVNSSFGNNGRVISCTHSSPTISGNSATATIITNSVSATSTLTMWLIQDSSFNWKIDNVR